MTALLTAAEVAASINDTVPTAYVVAEYRKKNLAGRKYGRAVLFDPADVAAWQETKRPQPLANVQTARSAARHRAKSA